MKYSVKVFESNQQSGSVAGKASVCFGDSLKVTGIGIVRNSRNGELFVSMPRYKTKKDGMDAYRDICNPITKEFRRELYQNILDEFEKLRSSPARDAASPEAVYHAEEKESPKLSAKVTLYERKGRNLKGFASVFVEDCFIVNSISILEGKNGNLYVSMPSYKTNQADPETQKPIYQDMVYPVTKESRENLNAAVMEAYDREVEKKQEQTEDAPDKEKPKDSSDGKSGRGSDGFMMIPEEAGNKAYGR